MIIQLPLSIISQVRTLADNTVRITLDCQEMSPEKMAELFTAKQSGELIQVEVDQEANEKTPSSRLRSVLYLVWNTVGQKDLAFDTYYKTQMERIIDKYKQLLN